MDISEVRFTAAPHELQRTGLLGWVALTLEGRLRIDGVALRRTADGRRTLAFPRRRDGFDREHFIVRPVSDDSRRELEHAVFRDLGLEDRERK